MEELHKQIPDSDLESDKNTGEIFDTEAGEKKTIKPQLSYSAISRLTRILEEIARNPTDPRPQVAS